MGDINYETEVLKDVIYKCKTVEELKEELLPLLKTQKEEWAHKFQLILKESQYKKIKFAELCKVSRITINKWEKGSIPKNRETFLKIGLAAGYNLEKMNHFLQRYGHYPALYSKDLNDCICIFVLNHWSGEEAIEKYNYILEQIKSNLIRSDCENSTNISTERFDEQLLEVSSEDELEQFIVDNIAMFGNAYHKLYSYIICYIQYNFIDTKHADNIYFLSLAQSWSSSLKQCVSAIRQNKWYPTRNKIISLGLHLGMDLASINNMLELAHMEPLCAKNYFESVILFILIDYEKQRFESKELLEEDFLFESAREIMEQFDLPDINCFISELQEDEDE